MTLQAALQGDVRKAEDAERWVREAVERFGRLDILVNCAAGNFLVRMHQILTRHYLGFWLSMILLVMIPGPCR